MTTFAVKFLGCKVSQADAMLARRALLDAGHREAPEAEAELHVINTCCITREAEAKSRQSVRRSLKSAETVYVDRLRGQPQRAPVRRHRRARAAAFAGDAEEVAASIGSDVGACADLEHDVLARGPRGRAAATRTRGFVKVQDGCDCHCAYCIIPTVRGTARSRPASAVLDEVRRRVDRASPRW